ncbi:phospholipase A [Robiginitalea marina]|uniref:Phosphatidylcholine 1-acylhydrolase n=1 Tax=Robiginitalea marina TaxID=2954105 RepID=A0ABT1AZT5_9FLAO|nr:phospholipase A [Robiginitalea marina]MCO5725090.1 phospholipase A [Robiginitalea marina]
MKNILLIPALLLCAGSLAQGKDRPLFVRDSLFQTLSERWEIDPEHYLGNFRITPYKPTYIVLTRWTSDTNRQPASFNPDYVAESPLDLNATELRFQISFKTKIIRSFLLRNLDLWVAYTQKSHWQVYNAETSRPFRETNYEPELILNYGMRVPVLGFDLRMAGLSFTHQSNGRSLPLSRSWNRIIFHLAMERENWQVTLRPWIRIPDSDDENPLIEDYYGRMEGIVTRQLGNHLITLEGTHSLRFGPDNRGSLRLGWVFPIDGFLRGHIEVFEGYGETLIDYNHRQFTIGLGLSLVEWR